jgi:hypothetical protein
MNPFDRHREPDRNQIWQRLVAADCEAFATSNWSMIENDFDAEVFEGIRCAHSTNPDDWKIAFRDLPSYRDSWLAAAREFRDKKFATVTQLEALLARTHLEEIEIHGDRALAHKKFFGNVQYEDGSILADRRQTVFRLHRRRGQWKIVGFFGQLPLDHE